MWVRPFFVLEGHSVPNRGVRAALIAFVGCRLVYASPEPNLICNNHSQQRQVIPKLRGAFVNT